LKEKLIIKNFGPIKEVDLDIGRFTILIGEQATGKSTVAKVLAVCRYFSFILENDDIYFPEPLIEGLIAWGLNESIKEGTYIYYACKHYTLSIHRAVKHGTEQDGDGNEKKIVPYIGFTSTLTALSKEFSNLLIELDKIKPPIPLSRNGWTIPTSFFLNDVKTVMDNPFYLPTQRGLQSIFDIGKNSIQNLSSALFVQLSKMDGIARLFKQETYIKPLDIYYVNRNGHGFIRKANETEFYSLYNAASGYQSMIPIVLVIKYYTELKKKNKTFLIEEPEQNLFPSAQNKLMQYLVDKTINFGNSILLTTQSPYILASVNNLIYAYIVGKENKNKINDIIPEKYWLDPSIVSAYRLLPDGTAKNIIDDDLNEIIVEELDGAGKEINAVYDKILDIKIRKNEESE